MLCTTVGTHILTGVLTTTLSINSHKGLHTCPFSSSWHSMTTALLLNSHTILQKSFTVAATGAWAAMYAFFCLYPYINGLVSNRAKGHPELTHIQEAGVDVLCPRDSGGLETDSVHVICSVVIVKETLVALL